MAPSIFILEGFEIRRTKVIFERDPLLEDSLRDTMLKGPNINICFEKIDGIE
jgi:hypothetical protein